jgi:type IV pilus assembly protein PilW
MTRSGKRQGGFSLIEVMLAVVLGLILTGGAISLFIANKESYRMAEALARVQETGRYALEAVSDDLRMAGHAGCAPRDQNGAVFVEATASDIAPGTFPPDPVRMEDQDSDGTAETLAISYASGAAINLATDMSSPNADVVLEADSQVEADGHAVIADCAKAEVFTATSSSVDSNTGKQTLGHAGSDNRRGGALLKAYQQDEARVMRMMGRDYDVRETGDTNDAGNPIKGLYRDDELILRGIEHMRIRFGECLANGEIAFRTWGSVGDPNAVVAAQVGFLVYSIQNVLESADQQSYSVAGTTIGPGLTVSHAGDPRLRRVFQTTVDLRNRPVDACHERT